MSQAALVLLASDGDDSASQSPSKRAISLLEGKAVPAAETAPPKRSPFSMPSGRTRGDVDLRRLEAPAQAASGLAAMTVGGVHGVGDVLTGRGSDAAAEDVKWWQQALTYQPRTPEGQSAAESLGAAMQHPANPLSWPGRAGEYAANSAEEAGWNPGLVTTLRMAPEVITALTGSPMAKGAGASVAADLRAAGPAAKRAAEVLTDTREIPPSTSVSANPFAHESMGAAAASPELKAASPELRAEVARATAAGEKIDRAALDRRLEAESLPIPMKLTKGMASQDVVQISHEHNRRGHDQELAHEYSQLNQQLIDNLDEIRAQAAPNAVGNDHVQNGQALIDSYKRKDAADSAEISAAYQALRDANGGDLPVDGQAFVAAADQALKKSMKVPYLPSQVEATLSEFRDGAPMTFENFENMRTTLAAEARKAERSGDGNAAAAIGRVREALESLPGVPPELKTIADTARSLAKARFDRLRADPAYKAAAEDSVSLEEASPLADDFVQKFVVKGKAANIRTMRENLSGDPHATETIAAGALNYVKSKSGVNLYTNEGNFSQNGYNRALSEITPKLDLLVDPKIAEQVQTLGNVARYTQFQPRGSFVNNSNTTVAAHASNIVKGVAERGVNAVVPGADLGTLAREKLGARQDKKFVREALDPASGITKKP